MAHRAFTFTQTDFACTAVDIGAGTAEFLVRKHDQVLSYAPDQVFSRHQIQMSGIAGGSYDVEILQPKGAQFVTHQSGAAEDDTVTIESVVAQQIKVSVTGMGGTAAPKLHFLSMPRMS